MEQDAYRINKTKPKLKLIPLYDKEDVEDALSLTRCYDFDTEIILDDFTSVRLLKWAYVGCSYY